MRQPLFHRVLGDMLELLPSPIATIHDIGEGTTWHGIAKVTAGTAPLARLVGALAGFPRTAESVPLSVQMVPHGDGEIWRRQFGDAPLSSRLRTGPEPGTIEETMSGVTVRLRLVPEDGGLRHAPLGVRLFGLSLPRLFWPRLDVRETAEGQDYRYSVAMHLWGMLLIRYEGHLDTRAKNAV